MASSAASSGAVTARGPLLGQVSLAIARLLEILFRLLCQASAVLVIVLAALLVAVLVSKSWLAIRTIGLHFFVGTTWDPVHRQFGALAFIYGTLATSAIAMLIAVPLGIGTAAFLSEIAPGWLRRIGSFLVEMLAAVPSVVYGFWGLFVMAPAVQMVITLLHGPNHGGLGILSAGLILSIMILPYIAAVSYDVCRAVPNSQRDGALALGATRWQTIRSVILPYARPGIVGGCFLALGRALGETMAVTMLIGNGMGISFSPFALGNSIASVIANEFTEATYDLYLSALVELGCVLLLVCLVVNTAARLLIRRVTLIRPGRRLQTSPIDPTAKAADQHSSEALSRSLTAASSIDASPITPVSPEKAGRANRLMTVVLAFSFFITVGPLFLILGHLIYQGVGSLNWDFFVKLPAPPGETGGGLANALYGSFLLVGLATLFAAPVGILAAIYLAEYRSRRLGPTVRFIGELLTGVPSIVIGIFAYSLIVHPFWWTRAEAVSPGKEPVESSSGWLTGHFSGWAGAFALGVIMIPIVMRASEEALKLVPKSIRDASYALGASRYQTVLRVVVPAALTAIITAVFLAIARIGGETAPLLMTAFGNNFWPSSPNDPTPSLPQYIFNYSMSPWPEQNRQAWAAALVLLAAVMLLNVGVRALTGKRVLLASRAE
jgi:phosphate transport system permease protein